MHTEYFSNSSAIIILGILVRYGALCGALKKIVEKHYGGHIGLKNHEVVPFF